MVFWIVISCVFIGLAVMLFCIAPNMGYDGEFGCQMGGVLCGALAVVILLISLITRCEYNEFEKQFEIQKAQYEILTENENVDHLTYIFDALESNRELAHWQAAKKQWGSFSNVPERVLDITPIGIK